ncbi:hypothetical protein BD413DRAFT_612420 [Trametes elegans]|nr:hypothetical protein BD413DRAFT_612420 [Trametes elegans]
MEVDAIDLGTEFDYLEDRLYQLRVILAAAIFKEPNSQDIKGDSMRFVIQRGLTTRNTVGRLNGLESHERRYGGDSWAAIVGANNDVVAQLTSGAGPNDWSDIAYGTLMELLWDIVIKAEFPTAVPFFEK